MNDDLDSYYGSFLYLEDKGARCSKAAYAIEMFIYNGDAWGDAWTINIREIASKNKLESAI